MDRVEADCCVTAARASNAHGFHATIALLHFGVFSDIDPAVFWDAGCLHGTDREDSA